MAYSRLSPKLIFDLDFDYLGRPKIFLPAYLGNVGSLSRMLTNCKNMSHINATAFRQTSHTPLHFACYGSSNLPTIIFLIRHGQADFWALDGRGRTPFHLACNAGDPEIIAYFLNELYLHVLIDTPDYYERTPLHAICSPGSSKAEKRRGEDLLKSLNLLLSKFKTKEDAVAALTRKDAIYLTPVMLAKYYGYEELYATFAKYGIDIAKVPEIDNDDPRVNYDYFDRTKLMVAAFDNDLATVKELLAKNSYYFDPNEANPQAGARTALHLACCCAKDGIADVVQSIVQDPRTNPLQCDMWRSSAMHFAAYIGRNDVMEVLLANKKVASSINNQDAFGMTALHVLALSAKRETMRLETLALLLEHGIDLFIEDNAGMTAYDVAITVGNDVVANTLLTAMCTSFNNIPARGGKGPKDGLTQQLIALERHVLENGAMPYLPLIHKTNYYHYDTDTSEVKVTSKLRTFMRG